MGINKGPCFARATKGHEWSRTNSDASNGFQSYVAGCECSRMVLGSRLPFLPMVVWEWPVTLDSGVRLWLTASDSSPPLSSALD